MITTIQKYMIGKACTKKSCSRFQGKSPRKWRKRNRAKLKRIAKLKKRCMAKIAGKEGFSCDSKGKPQRIDKKRSRIAKRAAKRRVR